MRHRANRRSGRFQASYHRPPVGGRASRRQYWRRMAGGLLGATMLGFAAWLSWLPLGIRAADPQLQAQLNRELPKGFFVWQIDKQQLADRLRSDYPARIGSVSISVNLSTRSLRAEITAPLPQLLWQSAGQVWTLDQNGRTIALQATENHPQLPLVVDRANLPLKSGQVVVPPGFVAFARQIAGSEFAVERFRITDSSRELTAELAAGYEVRFAAGEDVQIQLRNLARVQQLAEHNGHSIMEYVDVRIPFKAYYR